MNPSLRNTVVGLVLTALMLGTCPAARAQSRPRGPSIQFSTPRNPSVSTNVNALTVRKESSLKKLEEDLRQPFRLLERDAGGGSVRMLTRPPTGPVIQSEKVRELLDKEKNWAFANPEDDMKALMHDPTLETPEFDMEGREDSESRIFERYYEALIMGEAGMTNGLPDDLRLRQEEFDDHEASREAADPGLRAERARLRESELSLRQFFKQEKESAMFPDLTRSSPLPDLLDTRGTDSWQSRAQELRLDQFKQSLQADFPNTTVVSSPGLPQSDVLKSLGPFEDRRSAPSPASVAAPAPATPGISGFSRAGLVAAPSLSQPSQRTYTPPAPVSKPPPSPFVEVPKRTF